MSDSEGNWDQVSEQFRSLGENLKKHFKEVSAGGDQATKKEVKEAVDELTAAANRVATAAGNALRDPGVRADARKATDALIKAAGEAFTDLGNDLRKRAGKRSDPDRP